MINFVSKDFYDPFTREKVRWRAELSNGEMIYQDDNRPGLDEPNAWLRLREYVMTNNLSVIGFSILFWDHEEKAAPDNAEGYFFGRKVEAFAFAGPEGRTFEYYIVGAVNGNEIKTNHWLVPEIIINGEDVRRIDSVNEVQLIINTSKSSVAHG